MFLANYVADLNILYLYFYLYLSLFYFFLNDHVNAEIEKKISKARDHKIYYGIIEFSLK